MRLPVVANPVSRLLSDIRRQASIVNDNGPFFLSYLLGNMAEIKLRLRMISILYFT
jgi:hypothetical protein